MVVIVTVVGNEAKPSNTDEVVVGCLSEDDMGGEKEANPPSPFVGGDVILKALNGSNDELLLLVLLEVLKLPAVMIKDN